MQSVKLWKTYQKSHSDKWFFTVSGTVKLFIRSTQTKRFRIGIREWKPVLYISCNLADIRVFYEILIETHHLQVIHSYAYSSSTYKRHIKHNEKKIHNYTVPCLLYCKMTTKLSLLFARKEKEVNSSGNRADPARLSLGPACKNILAMNK